jgi:hypothetical protein
VATSVAAGISGPAAIGTRASSRGTPAIAFGKRLL